MEKDILTCSHDLAAARMADIDVGASSSTSTRGAPPHSVVAGAGLIRRRLGRRGADDIVGSLNWVISAESNVAIAGWAVGGGVGGGDVEGNCRSSSSSVEASMRPDECRRDGSCTGHPRIRPALSFEFTATRPFTLPPFNIANHHLQHLHHLHNTTICPLRYDDIRTSSNDPSLLRAITSISAPGARPLVERWPRNGPMRP